MRHCFAMVALAGSVLWLPAEGADGGVGLRPLASSVERFGKLELALDLPRSYANPFDAAEVDLTVEVRRPDGTQVVVPAFWEQPFERELVGQGNRAEEWLCPVGRARWRARLAPDTVGQYSCRARLRDGDGVSLSDPVAFECTPSGRHGFVKVSDKANRRFELTDGTTFFPLGHNLAFLYYGQSIRNTEALEATLRKLHENGANFVRVWAGCGDWALAMEWNKSAWSRTWEKKSPVVPLPGRDGAGSRRNAVRLAGDGGVSLALSPCARVALRPGTTYVLSGRLRSTDGVGLEIMANGKALPVVAPAKDETSFEREFTTGDGERWLAGMSFALTAAGEAWLTDLSLKERPAGPELLWEADVNRPPPGGIQPA